MPWPQDSWVFPIPSSSADVIHLKASLPSAPQAYGVPTPVFNLLPCTWRYITATSRIAATSQCRSFDGERMLEFYWSSHQGVMVTRGRQLSVTHTSVEDLKVLETQWKWWLKHILKALLLWVWRSCCSVCRKWVYSQLISISGLMRLSQNVLAWFQRQTKIAL